MTMSAHRNPPVPDFAILDSEMVAERSRWIGLWESWPNREPVAHPGYFELFAKPGERVMCAVQGTFDGAVLFPFIMRPLASLEWATNSDVWDVTGPLWGYTGPFTWGSDTAPSTSFWQYFRDWAHRTNVVSVFTRLPLFSNEYLEFQGKRRFLQSNVVRKLDLDDDELWMDVEHKVRKNVNRARRDGISVSIEYGDEALDTFLNIYTQTMIRRDASESFYFSRTFFENLLSTLNSMTKIFVARDHGRPVSVELILHSNRHAYSFLGGTLESDFPSRPNDLLKFELFQWAREEGLADVVLGGGPIPGDGIYRYKKSFSPNGVLPFYAGEDVFDPLSYKSLVEGRRKYELACGNSWFPDGNYFPAYRS